MELEVKEFPLQTQIGIFENEQDVEAWILTTKEKNYPFDYGYLIKHSPVIYTPEIQEYLIRYKMQKEYNIFSYSQNFDEIPADYIEILTWIDKCMGEAIEEKQRLNDAKR